MTRPSLPLAALIVLLSAVETRAAEPAFGAPTEIDNVWAPFVPGRVKVYRGRTDGARTASIDTFTEETRAFAWHGGEVLCRVLEEQEFEDGQLVEVALSWLAQDDEGVVHLFGEVSVGYVDGEPADVEPDSWLVGGPGPGDDPAVRTFDEPAIFMPATLAPGDAFVQDNDPATLETLSVKAVDVKVRVPAGRFLHAARLAELDDGEDGGPEARWIVPGIGTVKERAKGHRRDLLATSLLEASLEAQDP